MASEMDYKGIKERVEKDVRKQKRLAKFILFATDLGLFIMFIVIAWGLYLRNGGTPPQLENFMNMGLARPGDPFTSALVMLSIGWAVALILQLTGFLIDSSFGERSMRDRATGREMRKEMERLGLDDLEEHDKRKGMMRLTDDGELEAVDDVAEEVAVTPIKQNRKA